MDGYDYTSVCFDGVRDYFYSQVILLSQRVYYTDSSSIFSISMKYIIVTSLDSDVHLTRVNLKGNLYFDFSRVRSADDVSGDWSYMLHMMDKYPEAFIGLDRIRNLLKVKVTSGSTATSLTSIDNFVNILKMRVVIWKYMNGISIRISVPMRNYSLYSQEPSVIPYEYGQDYIFRDFNIRDTHIKV